MIQKPLVQQTQGGIAGLQMGLRLVLLQDAISRKSDASTWVAALHPMVRDSS